MVALCPVSHPTLTESQPVIILAEPGNVRVATIWVAHSSAPRVVSTHRGWVVVHERSICVYIIVYIAFQYAI
jgi:hypothetical protein